MSSSWSDEFGHLAAPLAVSLGLHLTLGAAVAGLPLKYAGTAPAGEQRTAPPIQAVLKGMPTPQPAASAEPTPQWQPVPPMAAPAAASGERAQTPASPYFLARELDVKPVPLAAIEPAYPNNAYLRGIPGSVVVQLHLDDTGKVEKAVILRANPPGYFEEAVRQAFLSAKFSPGMRGGHPVRVQMTIEVHYKEPEFEAPPPAAEAPGN